MDSADHGKAVLAAILAGRGSRKALDYAQRHLTPAHFTDPVGARLFAITELYLDQAGGVLTRAALEDALRSQPPGTAQLYREFFDALAPCMPASADSFRWSVQQLRELAAERLTGTAISQAMEILTTGAQDGRKQLRGHEDARAWLLSRFAEIDHDLRMADAPEGDMRTETSAMLSEYGRRQAQRAAGRPAGVSWGLPELDMVLGGGLQPGELDLIVGNTSAGKTSLAVQLSWHAAVMQGLNVVYFTTETLRPQIMTKLAARHSRLDKFGLREGLNAAHIKAGTLTPAGQQALAAVLADFASGPYGRMYVAQLPRGATMSTVEGRLSRATRQWRASLVVIDYLALMQSERQRRDGSLREDLGSIVKEAKQLAATYRDGAGVPVVSPWQVNRKGWEAAQQRGFYDTSDLAETAEASSTSDVLVSVLEPVEDPTRGRATPLWIGVIKNRDGERRAGPDQRIGVIADYATSAYISATARREDHTGLLGLG